MRNYIQDIIYLDVFNEEGKLVTKIRSMQKGALYYKNNGENSHLIVDDALFNIQMLEMIGNKVENDSLSDFDKVSSDYKEETIIRFKKRSNRPKFKLIGKGFIYDADTASISHDFTIIMPNVELIEGYSLELENNIPFTPSYTFQLNPYNNESDIFELRLKERK